jgi:hypothetical protein
MKTCIVDLQQHGRVGLHRVNNFSEFYQNSPKFNGFDSHQISKSAILLFTDLKYLKIYVKKLK